MVAPNDVHMHSETHTLTFTHYDILRAAHEMTISPPSPSRERHDLRAGGRCSLYLCVHSGVFLLFLLVVVVVAEVSFSDGERWDGDRIGLATLLRCYPFSTTTAHSNMTSSPHRIDIEDFLPLAKCSIARV